MYNDIYHEVRVHSNEAEDAIERSYENIQHVQ